ncbi:MAG TPA: ATP citrate lyase citrate-binding domain-containing protein [Candidatus Saccharimonadales bacterium]|nr:ATP citrate lyase citrate-binding domain-containing protein [Candidatus Saccharimonadales bacterium]
MARVKITEHKAKSLLLAGYQPYHGVAATADNAAAVAKALDPAMRCVVKVDQGVKRRLKQGLVALDLLPRQIPAQIKAWAGQGYERFLIEELVEHDQAAERYLSLERVRQGWRIMFAPVGGIDIEQTPEAVESSLYYDGQSDVLTAVAKRLGVEAGFLVHLITRMNQAHMAYLEINPLLAPDGRPVLIDCAALVDDAAAWLVRQHWGRADMAPALGQTPQEAAVSQLAAGSPSSFTLKLLNPDGQLFYLLSGGGASIVCADEAVQRGFGRQIANYGEYSGGPTAEETYFYTQQLVALLLESKARPKALVIAGAVANFTDVAITFRGIERALAERAGELKRHQVKVFVRRGGPQEETGLAAIKTFLQNHQLLGAVEGPEALLTAPVVRAVEYLA